VTDARTAIAIVVVSYGDPSILLGNPALRVGTGWRVVVVDNLSSTENRERARSLAGTNGWDLLEPPGNLGFGPGANLGIARAVDGGCDAFVLVNPDAELEPAAARALFDYVLDHPDSLASPRIVRPDGSTWFAGAWLDMRTGRTTSDPAGPAARDGAPWLSGACVASTADAWRRHGGFADGYFLYWEDIDLSIRWTRDGGRLEVLDDVLCTHAVGGTQQTPMSRTKSAAYYYYNCRNRLLFARRNLGRRARWRWALGALRHARAVLLRGGRRQLRRPGPTIGAALRGTAAGLRLLVGPGGAEQGADG